MATLEVHDGQGRVQFVELDARSSGLVRDQLGMRRAARGRGHPAGPRPDSLEVARRFKVEASPDAEFVVINGHKMTTSSIAQGDEITVGDCRMFLIRADEDAGRGRQGPKCAARGRPDQSAVGPPHGADRDRSSRRHGAKGGDRDEPPFSRRDDWLDSLQLRTEPRAIAVGRRRPCADRWPEPPRSRPPRPRRSRKPQRSAGMPERIARLLAVWAIRSRRAARRS